MDGVQDKQFAGNIASGGKEKCKSVGGTARQIVNSLETSQTNVE